MMEVARADNLGVGRTGEPNGRRRGWLSCGCGASLLLPFAWVVNVAVLACCLVYVLYGVLLVLEAEAAGEFARAAAQAYGVSLTLSFLCKDPALALMLTLLPTKADRRKHKVMDVVAEMLSRSPVELMAGQGV